MKFIFKRWRFGALLAMLLGLAFEADADLANLSCPAYPSDSKQSCAPPEVFEGEFSSPQISTLNGNYGVAIDEVDAPVLLDPFVVRGKPDYFYESDRRLKAVIDGLPDLSNGREPQKTILEKLSDFNEKYGDPNNMSVESQRMMLRNMGIDDNLSAP